MGSTGLTKRCPTKVSDAVIGAGLAAGPAPVESAHLTCPQGDIQSPYTSVI